MPCHFKLKKNSLAQYRMAERESESVCLLVYERKIKREFM